MSLAPSIRVARREDAEAVESLHRELYELHSDSLPGIFKSPADFPAGMLADEISGSGFFYVAEVDGKIVGYASGQYKDIPESTLVKARRIACIVDLIVDRRYRRMGLGQKLMEYVEERAREDLIASVELPVYAFNREASRFYDSLGYVTYVERKSKGL